ncbi:MAG TPA: tripartite tricarboxylate transporter TctB family protein [Alphaproteobacteria bacterium]
MSVQAEDGSRRAALGSFLIAAALAALGLYMLWETWSIPVQVTYARVGPRVFPVLVASGLLLNAIWLAFEAWRSPEPAGAGEPPVYWPALGWISAGLLLEAALLERIGFPLSAALLFVLTARGFGSTALLRDAAIGLALALLAWFGFTYGLGLTLPAGPLDALI